MSSKPTPFRQKFNTNPILEEHIRDVPQPSYTQYTLTNKANQINNLNQRLIQQVVLKTELETPTTNFDFVSTNQSHTPTNLNHVRNTDIIRGLVPPEHQERKNLITKNNRMTRIVHIDSRNRDLNPKNILASSYVRLTSNPLSVEEDSTTVTVYHRNHGFERDQKISIINVISTTAKVDNPLTLFDGSPYVKIYHPNHGLTSNYNQYMDVKVRISSVNGNLKNNSYILNIPINDINRDHTLYLSRDISNDDKLKLIYDGEDTDDAVHINNPNHDLHYYYIRLNKSCEGYHKDEFNNGVRLYILNLEGISLDMINSKYPLDNNHRAGYKVINQIIDENHYTFDVDIKAVQTNNACGGNIIQVAPIANQLDGFPEPNHYRIALKQSFNNVSHIKLISSEFPNTERVIKDTPEQLRNNRLYWQNLEDGEHVYTLEVPVGNYTNNQLAAELMNQFKLVERYNFTDDVDNEAAINLANTTNTPGESVVIGYDLKYMPYHRAEVLIDAVSDKVTIKMYQEVIASYPIRKLIKTTPTKPSNFANQIVIKHINHGLKTGDVVIISNALAHKKVPADKLNGKHTIEVKTIDTDFDPKDHYYITLPPYNEATSDTTTYGGATVSIFKPIFFRLLFNKPDTLGSVLGFRKLNESGSITPYAQEITNDVLYDDEDNVDTVGNIISVRRQPLRLSGENYILMTCKLFNNSYDTGSIEFFFAKIQLTDVPGTILFNSFISTDHTFPDEISLLSELEFTFYSPNGQLYDFNGRDHSFTLEIITNDNALIGTNENTTLGARIS